ncbi:MAG: hypothetical protein N2651_06740 [Fimbriimonadales bacterium]|nr:hypothetical protein [Fimbriimonadales bacterium]
MNRLQTFGLSAILALWMLNNTPAQGVTQAFTYQGFLRQSGAPVNNAAQPMRFRIYDAATGGNMVWDSGNLGVNVQNGLFTVTLNAPASVWTGAPRFLEIQINPAASGPILTPRIPLNPAPYANTATLLNLFQSGTNNPDRMVITHSPGFTNWGLQYRDTDDSFHFLANGITRLRIGLADGVLQYPLGAATGRVLTSDASGNASWQPLPSGADAWATRTVGTFQYDIYTPSLARFVGIGIDDPDFRLDVNGRSRIRGTTGSNTAGIWYSNGANNRAFIGLIDDNRVGMYGNAGAGWQLQMSTVNGNLGVGGGPVDDAKLRVYGTARVNVLEIEGADLAEKFPTTDTVEPGMVVEIDPDNHGNLRLARGAYNKRVAGVVAGANGLSKGIVLGNLEGRETHAPIAISGRVWVYADATRHAIEPGTLLTTSDKPGYAMAVRDRDRAHGAILGKAMTRLEKGKTGMVLVLVNLQ